MKPEVTHDPSSECQRRTSMLNRLTFGVALIAVATIIWILAFYLFSSISQKDPWLAHTVWRWRLLLGASATLSIVSAAIILWYRLLPGRPISALMIAVIFATLILPATSMSSRQRRELVSEKPFHGFVDTTKQYIAFSGTLIIGCVVASDRKRRAISEQKVQPELPSTVSHMAS